MCSRKTERGHGKRDALRAEAGGRGCRIKLCGLRRDCDIAWANELMPDYVGFVFAKGSKRYVESERAAELSRQLSPDIVPVGVFVDASLDEILNLLERKVIRAVQLHGHEDEAYVRRLRTEVDFMNVRGLRTETDGMILQAFRIRDRSDMVRANASEADYILLDSGSGSGETFDWSLIAEEKRPYFLAGGLTPENVKTALRQCHPFGVDASSSLETEGYKDREKMAAFMKAVRETENGGF